MIAKTGKNPSIVKKATDTLAAARQALEKGNLDLAEQKLLALLKKLPHSCEGREMLAEIRVRQGRADEALVLFKEVTALAPANAYALVNLGNVLITLNRHSEALAAYDESLKLRPEDTTALVNRGAALGFLGRRDEALKSYEAALRLDPHHPNALNNMGAMLNNERRHDEAVSCYERALEQQPDFPEALNNLGVSLTALNRHEEALAKFEAAILIKPTYAEALKNRAELLALDEHNEQALAAYDSLLEMLPPMAELYNNRATVLISLNRHVDGLVDCEKALELKPDYADAHNNRGIALGALHRFEEASLSFRRAIEADPDNVNAHWNNSLLMLRLGSFVEGWQEYEWRWRKPDFQPHVYQFKQPKWLGKEDISGKTVLVTAEQGFGDSIQFCRYLPMLEAMGAKVLFFGPEALIKLFRASFPNATIFSTAAAFPEFDFHCPLLSLPLAFATTLDSIPANIPYLRAPRQARFAWKKRLAVPSPGLRIGVAWGGRSSHKNDINRSMPLATFIEILSVPNVHFFVLQKEISAADQETLQRMPQVTLLGDELKSFADTAGAIESFDLVISVDTSTVHLAAALGKPTWILLPHIADWRWLGERNDSPWYPSARLYWQPGVDQWAPVLKQVASDIAGFRPVPKSSPPKAMDLAEAAQLARELQKAGKSADAEAICSGILQLEPANFEALELMGAMHLQQKRIDDAIACFSQAANARPDNVEAIVNLAGALRMSNRHQEALSLYDRASLLVPRSHSVLINRGVALLALKRPKEAIDSFKLALEIKPDERSGLNNCGVAYLELMLYKDALAAFDAVLSAEPDFFDALNNRGIALINLNRPEEAEHGYRRLLAADSENATALCNLGLALAAMNRIDESLQCFRKAQALKPDYVDAHWNESLMNLVSGNYVDGWRQYEWRWQKPEFESLKRSFHLPRWTGKEDIKDKTVFIYFEQGFGDQIQFVRYIDCFEARGAKVIMSCQPSLRRLFEISFPQAGFYCDSEILPPFDFHLPLLSLPLAFGTTLETIPVRVPYLTAPEDKLSAWQDRIPDSGELKVGLVWTGNPQHKNDINRSMPLIDLAGLLNTPNCRFYSLQKEVSDKDSEFMRTRGVAMIGDKFEDFTDTAAAIMQLDLVISVDTSVAHLAAALGKPLWLLLPFAPDWRWLLDRDDSVWYSTVRIFRQPAIGQWSTVAARIAKELPNVRGVLKTAPSDIHDIDSALQRAIEFRANGNRVDAETVCEALQKIQPDHAGVEQLKADLAHDRRLEAIEQARQTLSRNPSGESALIDLAIALEAAGEHQESLILYEKCLTLSPGNALALLGKSTALFNMDRLPEALETLENGLLVVPDDIKLMNNVGVVLNKLQKHERALEFFDQALSIDPNYFNAISGREAALRALNRAEEAIECDRKMQRLLPDQAMAFLNEALMNLLLGNYVEGFRQFEARFRLPDLRDVNKYPGERLVDVTAIAGKTVLLSAEQGFGDSIQFSRYINLLSEAGAKPVVIVPVALIELFSISFPLARVLQNGEVLGICDYYSPLLSLPAVFGTTLATIPNDIPYLKVPADRVASWQPRLPPTSAPKVGIVWSGNPKFPDDKKRSIGLSHLTGILETPNCIFYSLQKPVMEDELVLLTRRNVTLLGDEFDDFSDTAAAIMQLDLVISVDTAVAHLAGALGKPVWLMLPFSPDWRWLLDRADSPWYASARLFRQPAIADIAGLTRNIIDALVEWRDTQWPMANNDYAVKA